ncbi:MAG: type II toxin-antitoxin system Phd/YefM family antitoxin [Actinomycetota bacterium]|nr:type II toxin-antitoxin system Phd/YefM family antitoxin [Actinomycetota bacterium]
MSTEPLRSVRDHLNELVDRVEHQHERVVVTRTRRAAAVLVGPRGSGAARGHRRTERPGRVGRHPGGTRRLCPWGRAPWRGCSSRPAVSAGAPVRVTQVSDSSQVSAQKRHSHGSADSRVRGLTRVWNRQVVGA